MDPAAAGRFPPSFDDNPFTYAFAMMSLSLVTVISLNVVIGWLLEARRNCRIDEMVRNPLPRPLKGHPRGEISAVTLFRLIVGLLLTTCVMGAMPNVLILLAWGEGSPELMDGLFTFDRLMDGALIVPFLSSMFLLLRAAQVAEHKLAIDPVVIRLRPTRAVLREKMKLVILLVVIAVAVTLAKAYAP